MPVSVNEVREFQTHPNYARFVHSNLHMHTPATPWDWNPYPEQTQKAATLTPEAYFEALNNTSLELVAITDHNCVAWCKPLIELARQARKEGKSKIHILPGVEITTYEGPHLLAIFDETEDVDEVKNMLLRLGMWGDGREDDRVGVRSPNDEITIPNVLEQVDSMKGVIIAPHIHQKDGLWGNKEFRGRTDVLNNPRLRILAAASGEIKRVNEGLNRVRLLYKNMDSTRITNAFGFVNVSDCHRLEDFELGTTWIKMTTPSLSGIKQVIFEPELRIANRVVRTEQEVEYPEAIHFTEPTQASHAHIIALCVTGGMLNGQKAGFSPHQNSIIGKNYAGKSAILDCLRYVLDAVPFDADALDKFTDRIRAFVGEGGEVRAYLADLQGKTYGVSRTFACTQMGRGASARWRLEGAPDVFLLWNDEFRRESDLTVQKLFHVEVYPQGEVVKIKNNASQQMRIVDALAKVEMKLRDLLMEQADGEKTLRGQLADNGKEIMLRTERSSELSAELSGICQLQQEAEGLEKLASSPLFAQKKEWGDAGIVIDRYKRELLLLSEAWSSKGLLSTLEPANEQTSQEDNEATSDRPGAFDKEKASPDEYSGRAAQVFQSAIAMVKKTVVSNRDILDTARTTLADLETARKLREDKLESDIRSKLTPEDQGAEEGGLIDRITEKRKRLNELSEKARQLQSVKDELAALSDERVNLLNQFHSKWDEIRKARRDIVQMIDAQSAATIKADLVENADRQQYREILDQIADGLTSGTNRIYDKEAQLDALAEKVTPSQLIDIVKGSDANALTELAPGVKPNTARIILGMGQAEIHKLEECLVGDQFVISYKKAGDTAFTAIDSGLSGGEQALALVSVAMVPKQLPLIIDQPEDELGPALITNELVEQIRRVKSTRQMIFVTHVPNIPVLADSEQIIYVEQKFSSTGKQSVIQCCGSLDEPEILLHLLELDGGDIAFRKRSERYSAVIQSKR